MNISVKITDQLQSLDSWWLSWYPSPPADTREKILFAAFQEVHRNGFQAASIQNIINLAGVTKGGLYHYFDSKDAIGRALLDEVFTRYIENTYIKALETTDDPLTTLITHIKEAGKKMSDEDIALGCPLDHFSQEMAAINNEFQTRIDGLYQRKQDALVNALKRGQQTGTVVKDVSAESIALVINATLQGCMAMAKHSRSLDTLMLCSEGLFHYLHQLKPK